MSKIIFKVATLIFFSVLASVFGLGFSYNSFITPISSRGELSKIDGDRWLQDGATIKLKHLAARGNTLLISFDPWRPIEPARLTVTVCDKVATTLEIKDRSEQLIYLTGSCNPRTVSFKVENPFVGSDKDPRSLGAKVDYIKVRSKFGPPIVEPKILLAGASLIAILSLLVLGTFKQNYLAVGAILLSFVAILGSPFLNLEPPFSLWLLIVSLSSGIFLAMRSTSKEKALDLSAAWIVVVLMIGAAIRFYGLDFGLPANFHPDEVPKFNAIERMRAYGDLNPRYFLHPSLLLYSTYLSNQLLQFFAPTQNWSETLIFAGRIVSATAGILSIYITYLIGSAIYSRKAGLIGAILLALSPLHITCSRYVKEDSLLTFWILLSSYLVIKAVNDKKIPLLYLAGLVAGAAASTKYSGILAAIIPFSAPWLSSRSFKPDYSLVKHAVSSCFLVAVGFVLCTPYSIFDHQTFLTDVLSEKDHMNRGHMGLVDPWSQYWLYHFSRSIVPGMTFMSAFLGTAGLGLIIWRRRVPELYLVALFLLFYLPAEYVNAKPAPQPERYILPCLPYLSIAAGMFVTQIMKFSRVAGVSVISLAIAIASYRSVTLASEIKTDTRTTMLNWMNANIKPGSKIIVDWKPYNPPFQNSKFEIIYLPREDIISHLRLTELKSSGADYILLSSLYYSRFFDQPNSDPAIRTVFRKVFSSFQRVKEIKPRFGTYGFHNPKLILLNLKEPLS